MRACKGFYQDPIFRVKKIADEAKEDLMANINVMDTNVNAHFVDVEDDDIKKYLELSSQMQDKLKEICGKIGEVSDYCQGVIDWFENFTSVE